MLAISLCQSIYYERTLQEVMRMNSELEDRKNSEPQHLTEIEQLEQQIIDNDTMHPVDRAEHMETLPFEKQVDLVKTMSPNNAADTLAELDEEHAGDVLESLTLNEAVAIVSEMSPDDAVDVLDELDQEQRDSILNSMPLDDAEELRSLLNFDPETAAGVMNTQIIILHSTSNADAIIAHIRSNIDEIEDVYYVYIVDDEDALCNIITMRDLMRMPRNVPVHDYLGEQELITIAYDMPKKDLGQIFIKYGFASLPVVDRTGRILGVITHDDAFDLIQDEASSDMLGMVGAGQDEDIDTYWLLSVKMRLPWLLVNLFNSSLSACVVYLFDGTIAQMATLAVLMPIVANQSGNTGQQALAVMIRQLAVEAFNAKKAWKAVIRETKIGLLSSVILSLIAFLGVYFLFDNEKLALVMICALSIDMILGAVFGASIPLILRSLGRDPAQASSIFLTAVTDGVGFFVFLGLASLFLF